MAALLLFAKDPTRWHPRAGIDFVKYEGNERQHGTSLNVVKRIRFEAPLVRLIDEAVGRIKEHIRERTILHDLFFRERLEYPTFAWQEALVNAVAHRDYSLAGAPVEVWMFDDHISVRSPGLPPPPVTLEHLRQQKSIHFSRNPLIVRVLADLGYLREMGEGVPRIYQGNGNLRPPSARAFRRRLHFHRDLAQRAGVRRGDAALAQPVRQQSSEHAPTPAVWPTPTVMARRSRPPSMNESPRSTAIPPIGTFG